ncbi:MAG: tetratricopeptide repeat protein [Deltaproteobacteria bacterium]|nr:tetratricopeptide repeat protein [Deltaproteobacteria bacterium]
MAKKKISRKEMLKKPDEFISITGKTIDFVKGHKRLFDYLGTAILGAIVIYIGVYAYMRYVNNKGKEAFNTAFYSAFLNTGSEEAAADPKKAEELFGNVVEKYGISKAAKLALPELAYAKFEQKQYDEAIAMYEEYLGKVSEKGPYRSLACLALSTCYEQKGEYDKAITPLEDIMQGPDDFIKEQAMLNMARIYRLDNKQDRAKEVLNQLKEKFPDSVYYDMADSLINS